MSLFDRAAKELLRHEGGYVHDPHDPGGETNFGISKRSYPHLAIALLTEQDALAIYKRDFWDALGCEHMAPALAVLFFDAAVNQGPHAAVLDLQAALCVKQDGVLGPETLKAAKAATPAYLAPFIARRAMRYALSRNLTRYGLGWFTRLAEVSMSAADLA